MFVPGLSDLANIAVVSRAVALPLNVLWQPGVGLDALSAAGVARVSTGSALYRHALAGALAAADAARAGRRPVTTAVDYRRLKDCLNALKDHR